MDQDTVQTTLAAEVLRDAEERALELIRCGFQEPDEIAESLVDDLDGQGLTVEEAERIVAPLWRERLREQAAWPETTDVDRLEAAFDALEELGIVAAMDFTCCANCGYAEIGGEAEEDSRGFVFFHQQDTERAADGGALMLRYGGFQVDGEATEAAVRRTAGIGREVAAALTAAGLPVEWNGSPDSAIAVTPITWLNRLPE
ncbi:DUF6891 domain-containing protein [Kitasatospora sp. NPDC057500]|uniref:DUF6891 domain-containing protein n=1 Tax=Kitasatospora sp. NPDC057500 TaxID=3346151 RepID=UPI00369F8114